MDRTELEFIESAKRLREGYKQKLANLEQLIAAWESGSQAASNGSALKPRQIPPSPMVSSAENAGETPAATDTATDWIRYAIQLDPDRISNPGICGKIQAADPEISKRVSSGRISAQLYHLAKTGQIVATRKVPGGASEYQITDKYKPWGKIRRSEGLFK